MNEWFLQLLTPPETKGRLVELLRNWREDSLQFLRHDVPKLLLVIAGTMLVIRLLQVVTRRLAALQKRHLPGGIRAKQIGTLAGVINGLGMFAALFLAMLQILSLLGFNLAPLLASAGIVGLAIGFGAQTLVHDVINGFFILLEDQFDVGDTIRIAGVKGMVEQMSLRRTVLRDDDGTLHMVPNNQITIVSNQTRDWAQIPLRVTVAYDEPSDRVVGLLKQVGEDVRHDPAFANDIVSDIQIPGLDRVGNGEAEYLMLVKTRPNKQYGVSRELQRRIKEVFSQNQIHTPGPGRLYIANQGAPPS